MSRLGGEGSAGTHLHKVANEIRTIARNSRKTSLASSNVFQNSLISLIVLVAFAAMVFLSVSEEARTTLIQKIALSWSLLETKEPDFYQLPPPRPDLPHFLVGAPSRGMKNTDLGNSVEEGLSSGDGIEEVSKDVFEIPSKDSNFEKVFKLLTENSEFIKKLISGQIPGLLFDDWQPIRVALPNYWLTLEVQDVVTGEAIKLAWSFDIETLKPKPENQSARDQFFKMKLKEK